MEMPRTFSPGSDRHVVFERSHVVMSRALQGRTVRMEGFTAVARWFGGHGCSRRGVVTGRLSLIGLLATGCGVDTAGVGASVAGDQRRWSARVPIDRHDSH